MSVILRRFILSLFLLLCCLNSFGNREHREEIKASNGCIVITLPYDNDKIDSIIDSSMDKAFQLNKLTYESDLNFSKKEFLYLCGLKEGSLVSPVDIKRAVSCLIKKKKFLTITLTICPYEGGEHLHVSIQSFWEFQKLKFHGILVGKEQYKKYYLLEPGDAFSTEKHDHSITKIQNAFFSQGYLEGKAVSAISYDKDLRLVTVDITLDRGKKFSIGNVGFLLKKAHVSSRFSEDLDAVKRKIDKLFTRSFFKHSYSKSLINKGTRAIKRFLSQQGFLHVDIDLIEKVDYQSKMVHLSFILTVHSKKEFVFFGNTFFTDAQLMDKVLLFGRSAWLVPASILSGEIARAYDQKGFWNIAIKSKEEHDKYFFFIKEGVRANVAQVAIHGVTHVDAQTVVSNCFSKLIKAKNFDSELLKSSIDSLMNFYLKEGFWDIKILKHEFIPLHNDHAYKLVFTVDEGMRRYLQSITIENFEALRCKGPFAKCKKALLPIGFDPNLLKLQRTWLVDYFKKKGYLHVAVTYELQEEGQYVGVIWRIDKGQMVTFGKTIILGSLTFPWEYIARELCYKEGEAFDNDKLKKTISGMRALEIFEHAYLYPGNISLQEEQKDILLKLQPADPFQVRTRIGLGLHNVNKNFVLGKCITYKVGGLFLYRNPTNCADQLIANVDVSISHRNLELLYRRPWILSLPLRILCKLYSNRYDQPGFVGSKCKLYEVTQEGFLISINKLYRALDFSTNIGIEWMRTQIKNNMSPRAKMIARAINFDSRLLGVKIPYLWFEPTLLIDYVDDKLNPKIGSFTLVSVKGMFPLSKKYADSYFVKLLATQSFFYPILDFLVFACRFRFGHVFHQSFKEIMPIERFYLGGSHSIRGYETDLCPPLGSFLDECNVLRFAPQGGRSMVNTNIEFRFPVYKAIGAVVFQDLGTLIEDIFKRSNLLAATGFGLRFNTPVGPIRFDIGWKWHRKIKNEPSYAWFLSFGNTF